MVFLIYIVLGIFVGTLSGIFGIGGGLVIVPTLLYCFKGLGFPTDLAIRMAIGTSLATILVTVSSSAYAHHKNGNVDWGIVKKICLWIIIGGVSGTFISGELASDTLEIIFSIFVVLVAIKMFTDIKVEREYKPTGMILYGIVGFIIGLKSTILGIGGGTISIPFLTWRGVSMKKAVGVSASIGIPIALSGVFSYIYTGMKLPNLPQYSLGLIYLPAFFGVILTSSYFAKVGAKISNHLPQDKMKKGFALFLFLVAIKMFAEKL